MPAGSCRRPAIVELEVRQRLPPALLKEREAELILKALPPGVPLVALDERRRAVVEPRSRRPARPVARPRLRRARLCHRRRRGARRCGPRTCRGDLVARADDLAASPGARHAARAALPRAADPRRPSLSPGVSDVSDRHRCRRHLYRSGGGRRSRRGDPGKGPLDPRRPVARGARRPRSVGPQARPASARRCWRRPSASCTAPRSRPMRCCSAPAPGSGC